MSGLQEKVSQKQSTSGIKEKKTDTPSPPFEEILHQIKKPSLFINREGFFCGADGVRTRDLLRDRQAL